MMKKELLESYELIRKTRQEIPTRVKNQDVKEYLELVIKNNFLEAQNVQLLLNLQLQARTISQLKSMIMRQQRFIQENHLDSGEGIAKVFSGKQFEELEEDEDYRRLLVASPEIGEKVQKVVIQKVEEDIPPQVEEFVGIIMGAEVPSEEGMGVPTMQENQEEPIEFFSNKEDTKGEEISITGVPAFKIEGKSVGPAQPAEKEKKAAVAKTKATKESKTSANKGVPVQPANLSIMGSKISSKKGAQPAKGKPK